jgi:hypothetical protein
MEKASARKVAAVASERDEAKQQVLQLRKDRLLELAFSQAGAAAVIRGSAARSPRLWARAARSSLSSRPMLAAITAVLGSCSNLARRGCTWGGASRAATNTSHCSGPS